MSKIDKVFRYAEQYAAEQYTDTGDMIKKEIESGKAELSALRARVEALEHLEAVAQDVNEWLKTSAGLKGSAHQRELEGALKA